VVLVCHGAEAIFEVLVSGEEVSDDDDVVDGQEGRDVLVVDDRHCWAQCAPEEAHDGGGAARPAVAVEGAVLVVEPDGGEGGDVEFGAELGFGGAVEADDVVVALGFLDG
jgi:hypothetical protein